MGESQEVQLRGPSFVKYVARTWLWQRLSKGAFCCALQMGPPFPGSWKLQEDKHRGMNPNPKQGVFEKFARTSGNFPLT